MDEPQVQSQAQSRDAFPDQARVVIIGGGVIGASIAYHLTKMGWDDVLLIDRSELTSGSTFHSAGLIAQLRNSVSHTRMMMYGVELYPTLERETGVDLGWHQVRYADPIATDRLGQAAQIGRGRDDPQRLLREGGCCQREPERAALRGEADVSGYRRARGERCVQPHGSR